MATPETTAALEALQQRIPHSASKEARDNTREYQNQLLLRAILAELVGIREDLAKGQNDA